MRLPTIFRLFRLLRVTLAFLNHGVSIIRLRYGGISGGFFNVSVQFLGALPPARHLPSPPTAGVCDRPNCGPWPTGARPGVLGGAGRSRRTEQTCFAVESPRLHSFPFVFFNIVLSTNVNHGEAAHCPVAAWLISHWRNVHQALSSPISMRFAVRRRLLNEQRTTVALNQSAVHELLLLQKLRARAASQPPDLSVSRVLGRFGKLPWQTRVLVWGELARRTPPS